MQDPQILVLITVTTHQAFALMREKRPGGWGGGGVQEYVAIGYLHDALVKIARNNFWPMKEGRAGSSWRRGNGGRRRGRAAEKLEEGCSKF